MKKYILHSFLLAFFISLITTTFLFPQISNLYYTDISGGIKISSEIIIKIVLALGAQTSIIGSIFYFLAKKMFIDKQNNILNSEKL